MQTVEYQITLSDKQYRAVIKALDSMTKRHKESAFAEECEKVKKYLKDRAIRSSTINFTNLMNKPS